VLRLVWSATPGVDPEEQEIDALYGRLGALADRDDDTEYRECLARLRQLQRAAAKRMADYFEQNSPLQPDDAQAAIARAKALLARHEAPPSADAPPDGSD